MFKKIIYVFLIVIIAGLSGIFFDRYLFPRLALNSFFSKYDFFKKSAENVTVINKTEQIYIRDNYSVEKIASPILSSVVNIISYPEKKSGNFFDSENIKNRTGVIITSDGIIMAYLDNSEDFLKEKHKIITSGGDFFDGEIIAFDSWSNLVFIKIVASNLPVLPFDDSQEYKVGDKVIAVGNNLSFYQNSFIAGVLSKIDYSFNISNENISRAEKLEGVFFSDLNLSDDYLGSPIVDYSGKVLGVVGSTIKNNEKIYFQIPSQKIRKVLNKIIEEEIDSNPSLGAYFISNNKSFALANGLKTENGAIIYSKSNNQGLAVVLGSPAFKAGLRINDIITKVDDKEINLHNNLSEVLYDYSKGEEVNFSVLRGDQEIEIKVQL
jgi:serine protease Do